MYFVSRISAASWRNTALTAGVIFYGWQNNEGIFVALEKISFFVFFIYYDFGRIFVCYLPPKAYIMSYDVQLGV